MKMDPASRADTAARTTRMGQTMAAGAVYQPLCGAFQARGTQHGASDFLYSAEYKLWVNRAWQVLLVARDDVSLAWLAW
ncbi:hypothetical protein F751_2415 [Auxenochlorella protothecoides]|uniref:Uncharacterized protein n=1 Tax=Auxenochlorella protothecoides TaxID=3075 RepID=A0A087SG43_AUXPR|nr:hypothetical protein F751_2415 [Auxenochlorella protothecoides]KFM24697.1 hypothetical protein F751_2415 [Auxenochlorella protothecoides]